MRTKKALYNNISAVILQIITLVFGLILPRLKIGTYGSELNGLVSSSNQIVSYLKYLELGLTSALIYTLYQPLAKMDYAQINSKVARAKKEYSKISLLYFFGVILISLVYPLVLKEELGYGFVVSLIFFIGIYGALDFYSLSKYRVLLTADQKQYVITLTTIITVILQNLTSIVLVLLKQPLHLIVIIPTLFLPIRSFILKYYVKRNYTFIDYNSKPSESKIKSRIDAFITGLSRTLNLSLPIVIISMVVSLEMASVFSIYSMIFFGIFGIVNVFTQGMSAGFGNMFAKGERKTIVRANNDYEFLLYFLLTILYSCTLALIIPFITVYMADVADINYIYPIFGLLLTVWSVLHTSRIPNSTIISASGNWKMETKTNIIQIIILTIGMFILGYYYGIVGILIMMIVSSLYKTIVLMYISNKNILKISSKTSIVRLIRIFIIIFITNFPLLFNLYEIKVNNFFQWIVAAVVTVIVVSTITMIINLLLDWQTSKGLYNRYIKRFFKKKIDR